MSNEPQSLGFKDTRQPQDLPAGGFSAWLQRFRTALVKENGADVPCGDCNACCRSSYFIHIRPEETETLSHIPKALLFPAPGLPQGNRVLGYNEHDSCPMLIDEKCSIYGYRPLTCHSYDCRIFSAAGIAAGEADKSPPIPRWQFSYPTQRDRDEHDAVQAAAKFLQEHTGSFPIGRIPGSPVQLAILAIKVYNVFLKLDANSGKTGGALSDNVTAKTVMAALEKFETGQKPIFKPEVVKCLSTKLRP
jgi:Fe-S-cluster containining protein